MSQTNGALPGNTGWTEWEKTGFRIFFIFFVILLLPLDGSFFGALFSGGFRLYDLVVLTRYRPRLVPAGLVSDGQTTDLISWAIALAIAIAGGAIWTWYARNKDRDAQDYDKLYYWLRVALRYRLAAGIIAYGFIKLFPLQMPYPSLSNLHTNYGDFEAWKIYYHTIGIIPWYESFLGGVEILAGLLLFSRNTATFGAGILLGFIGNVLSANFAYNIGDQSYTLYLELIALFLLSYDVPRLYNLIIARKLAKAGRFNPSFNQPWVRNARLALKAAFGLFILFTGLQSYRSYKHDPYLVPRTPGLSDAYGFYDVKEFRLNQRVIPYTLTDPDRWQNVVFEQWATLSVKIAGLPDLDRSDPDKGGAGRGVAVIDQDRDYEAAGAGGRKYFSYTADTVNQTLLLRNKDPKHRNDSLVLHYSRPDASTILLRGIDEKRDSINIALNKIEKKYMLFEGRRKPLTL